MRRALAVHRDQRGLVGKLMVIWLALIAVLAVAAVDAGSIGLTTFKLSSVAVDAASDGAAAFRNGSNADQACSIARETVATQQPDVRIGRNFCRIDPSAGEVTITLRARAGTILAGRLDATKHYTEVVRIETNGPSGV